MNYIKLFKRQKTLIIPKAIATTAAFVLVGAYSNMPLPNSNSQAQAHSVIQRTSTLIPTGFQQSPVIQTAQSATDISAEGAPDPNNRLGAGTHVQNSQPSPEGAPNGDQRQGAASRGTCPRVDTPLTALVPLTQDTSETQGRMPTMSSPQTTLGLTVSPHPTFWFYLPYQLTSALPVEFVLQDENGNDVYQTRLTKAGTAPGVVGFKLPASAPTLAVNKRYKWFLLVYCSPTTESDYVNVEGWVRRVAMTPSIKAQLEQATPQQSVALYTKSDIWHEAVSALAELRRQHPNDVTLKAQWANLLKSINLEAYASEPISSVITLEK